MHLLLIWTREMDQKVAMEAKLFGTHDISLLWKENVSLILWVYTCLTENPLLLSLVFSIPSKSLVTRTMSGPRRLVGRLVQASQAPGSLWRRRLTICGDLPLVLFKDTPHTGVFSLYLAVALRPKPQEVAGGCTLASSCGLHLETSSLLCVFSKHKAWLSVHD
jgi:hypothetical protein